MFSAELFLNSLRRVMCTTGILRRKRLQHDYVFATSNTVRKSRTKIDMTLNEGSSAQNKNQDRNNHGKDVFWRVQENL